MDYRLTERSAQFEGRQIFISLVALLTFAAVVVCGGCGDDKNTGQREAVTWSVDPGGGGDFKTIRECIASALDTDTCLVHPGTYKNAYDKDGDYRNIDFRGKAITVRSASGPEVTILDGNGGGPVVVFDNGEGTASALDGFTITNGQSAEDGGGIYILGASPRIKNCVITGNQAEGDGGGIYCLASNAFPEILHTIFSDNRADQGRGGALYIQHGSPLIFNCLFYGNSEREGNQAAQGGALFASYGARPSILNCTFSGNQAGEKGGALYSLDASPAIRNSILWADSAPSGNEIFFERGPGAASISLSYVDLAGAVVLGDGCPTAEDCVESQNVITAAPIFVTNPDTQAGFYLSQPPGQTDESPCVDQGDRNAIDIGLDTRTTNTEQGSVDAGIVDLGFHYPENAL